MATIFPFRAWRYSAQAGDPASLLTQPYDKITTEMQDRYYQLSPYNLVRVILGRREASDNDVYTRAAAHLDDWIASGILAQEPAPALFAYFQEFQPPDEPAAPPCLRKGLIALGPVEDYSRGVVYRHELTHSGPKRDRLELLRRTRAHCEQLFLLYDDPQMAVDAHLDRAAAAPPLISVTDEYGAEHTVWRISDPAEIAEIQRLLRPQRLLIADGHHRYETALAFRNENPSLAGACKVMMTLVNMRSPGLVILATHRVVSGLENFDARRVLEQARTSFRVEELPSLQALRKRLDATPRDHTVFGGLFHSGGPFFAFETADAGRLDVTVLHEDFLERILGLNPEAVREQRHVHYVRGFDAAVREINAGAQAVFFLRPLRVEQVAEVAFSGGVMPQKSTDFYPKLLSGITIYRIED